MVFVLIQNVLRNKYAIEIRIGINHFNAPTDQAYIWNALHWILMLEISFTLTNIHR